jgi:hypothetical protein
MTSPFVSDLRTTDDIVRVGGGNGAVLHLRVQLAELWEALRVDAPGSATVQSVKEAALMEFFPNGADPAEFVTKVRGFEILRENESLEASGVRDGSTILLAWRRRRPVK